MRHAQLSLYDNGIGPEGAAAISEALKVNGSLTSLDVSENTIKNEGAVAIGEALKINGSLTSLDVRFNSLDEAMKQLLRDSVKDRNGFALQL